MTAPALPEDFRHRIRVPIRYGDLDTLGHVNNAKYLTYLEQSRITYFRDLELWDGYPSELGLIVARICVDYKLPLRIEDEAVDVWARVSRLGNKSFTLSHLVNRSKDGATAATSEIVMVVFDYIQDTTVPMPAAWRERLTEYEPGLSE